MTIDINPTLEQRLRVVADTLHGYALPLGTIIEALLVEAASRLEAEAEAAQVHRQETTTT